MAVGLRAVLTLLVIVLLVLIGLCILVVRSLEKGYDDYKKRHLSK